MTDKRIKSPRLMSKVELVDHLARFHDDSNPRPVRSHHDRLHHLVQTNHRHRSARVSEASHPDWRE